MNYSPGTPRSKRAFTLIELLVVIAIIAILAAILFPVFAQAKEAAKKSTCISNVKNIVLASLLYSNDYDDGTVPNMYWDSHGNAVNWFGYTIYRPGYSVDPTRGLIYPYLKGTQILSCPDSQTLVADPYESGDSYGISMNTGVDGFNGIPYWTSELPKGPFNNPYIIGIGGFGGPEEVGVTNMSGIEIPAETIWYGDAAEAVLDSNGSGYAASTPYIGCDFSVGLQARHGGQVATAGWFDGHAKAIRLTYSTATAGQDPWDYIGAQNKVGIAAHTTLSSTTLASEELLETKSDCYYYIPIKN